MPWNAVFEAAFASSLISLLATKLVHLAIVEIGNIRNVGRNLGSLSDRVWDIQTTLDRLGDEHLSDLMRRECVDKFTKLFYEVDDIIDGINIDIMMKNHEPSSHYVECTTTTTTVLSTTFTRLSRVWSSKRGDTSHQPTPSSETQVRKIILSSLRKWCLPHKIRSLHDELDCIEQRIQRIIRDRPSTSAAAPAPAAVVQPGIDVSVPIASFFRTAPIQLVSKRERAMTTIIEHLIKGRGVSIVGMAGLGKTTLARCITRHNRIRNHFNCIIWASVPGGVFSDGSNLNFEQQSHVKLVDKGKQHLGGRNTLLVLDHLRRVHYRSWKNVLSSLDVASYGKVTVLITTLNPRVAADTDTTRYHLELLSDQDCEELIRNNLPENVRHQYGQRIAHVAKKCAGLPLVAHVLGMEMGSGCREEEHHQDSQAVISRFERDLWNSDIFREQIFPYLRFQETLKPPELNKFLAYLSLFPVCQQLKKHELSQLWMADGFVHPEEWNTEGLENALQYFDNLLSRSLLLHLPNNKSQQGAKETPFQIHEFTHRLARSLAHNMYYQIKEGAKADHFPPPHTRHLSILRQNIEPHYLENITSVRLRTLLLLHEKGTDICKLPESLFHSLRLLRVLKLGKSGITDLPISIGYLKHLRYLDASNTHIKKLPNNICNLLGLRIIKLKRCPLLYLPNNIAKLVNLIHLDVDMTKLAEPPQNIGLLTKLQSLETFIVKEREGHHISELRNLNDLQGSIRILELENVTQAMEARDARLEEKAYLKTLELEWEMSSSMREPSVVREIVEQLLPKQHLPNRNLSELRLMSYRGDKFPSWLSSSLSCHLSTIHLFNCSLSSIQNAKFWRLRSLKFLLIDEVHEWRQVGQRFFGGSQDTERFVSLEKLELRNMENLATWEGIEQGDVMPRLRHLKLEYCPSLSALPRLNHLNALSAKIEIVSCLNLRVVRAELPPYVTYTTMP